MSSSATSPTGSGGIYGPFTPHTAPGAQAVNRSSVAALAFLVWDILITFDDEVQYIWSRKWTYTKIVYFVARYLPLMVETSVLLIGSELTPPFHFSARDCYIWQVFQGVSASTIILTVDTVLILRVYALYHENRVVRIAVAIFFGIEIVGMVVGLALTLPGIIYDDVCLVTHVPTTLTIYAASSIVFQTFLFFLTVYKILTAVRAGWGHIPLVKLLIRDGSWAFFLLFVMYVGQLGLYGLHNRTYSGVLYGWMLTLFSFCGYRLLINLSRLAEPMIEPQGPTIERTGTNIEFTTQMLDSNITSMSSLPTTTPDRLDPLEPQHGRIIWPPQQHHRPTRFHRHHRDSRNWSCRNTRTFDNTSPISTLSLGH